MTRYKQKSLHIFRKPGERPNGNIDGTLREFFKDVDIVCIRSFALKLPGDVLIIIDVKISSQSSISCR
jgi:hypothetical protein